MQNFSEQNSQIQLMRQQLLHFFHQRLIAKFLPWAIFCLPWNSTSNLTGNLGNNADF